MADVPKKPKQKPHDKKAEEELMERDLMEFAQLLFDIYQEKKWKEKNNDVSSNI